MDIQFNGLGMGLGNLPTLSNAKTRSISAENPDGAKGGGARATEGVGAKNLGRGWKISPCIPLPGNSTTTLVDIAGPGAIQQIWMTVHHRYWRQLILRCYWDGEETPSVEVPLGDFFSNGWCEPCHISSFPIAVNPRGGFNSYWLMPFRRSAKVTIENLGREEAQHLYYQINYTLTSVPEDMAYFHAQYRRNNPLPYQTEHTILDNVQGQGHYVGTYIAWGSNNNGWWGEGEMKFYLDGDEEYPTICGTGTEDYFGGAWGFDVDGKYATYSTPFLGFPQWLQPNGFINSQTRFGLYRWHVMDPIRFQNDLRVTIQALGWRRPIEGEGRYLPLQDDIASTAFWYQTEPHVPFSPLPDAEALEVI